MFSKFFINRPIFATVLALLIVVAGLVTLNILPVAQFPEITPPTVQVSAVYPGANAETVAQTVGIPIEQQVNGVDGMLYMSSNSSSSGAYSLTITFAVGTDIDMATVQVQNRVSIAQSSLPEPVVVQGVTVQKQSSNIVMFLTMTSQDSVYNSLYLTNYAKLNLVDQLTRVPGVGAVNVMGAGDYSMRIWLDPEAMRIRNISPQQVYQSIQSQNVEVSAGYIGQPIGQDNNNAFQYTLNVQGRLKSPEQFGNIIIRREQDGAMLRLKDIARIDLGSASYSVVSRLNGKPTAAIAIYQQPGSNSLDVSKGVKAKMEELSESFPSGVVSTGSLGQGISAAVGMALAGKADGRDYRVYALLGDGEIEEGQVWEAAMAAAKYRLDNLCAVVDVNGLQIDGATADVMPSEPLDQKFEAFNWNVIRVDGHDYAALAEAFAAAAACKGKPTVLLARTVKGKGVSFMEGDYGWHGKAPNAEQYEKARAELAARVAELEGK